jgi:hypothetical protein
MSSDYDCCIKCLDDDEKDSTSSESEMLTAVEAAKKHRHEEM